MDYDELVKDLRNYSLLTIDPLSTKIANAADAIEELLEKFEQLPRWIPATERLPEVECDVLIAVLTHFPNRKPIRTVTMDYINTVGVWDGASCDWRHEVTHWIPLPAPPKEEQA